MKGTRMGGSKAIDLEPRSLLPWERGVGEPAGAYSKFLGYLSLGPRRTLAQTAEKCRSSPGRLKQLSSRWQWLRRAIAWDQHQFLKRRREELQSWQDARQRALQGAAELQSAAWAGVSSWLTRDNDGDWKLTRELSPVEALRLYRIGCQAELQLRGQLASAQEAETPSLQTIRRRLDRELGDLSGDLLAYAERHLEYCDQMDRALRVVIRAWLRWWEESHPEQDLDQARLLPWPWDIPFHQYED